MNIPEGYVLVPVEPTRIQLVAGLATNGIHPIYCAMVAAAQPVEFPAYDEAKERELFELRITKFAKEKNYHFMKNVLNRHAFDGSYLVTWVDMAWLGWSESAKSRARSAE